MSRRGALVGISLLLALVAGYFLAFGHSRLPADSGLAHRPKPKHGSAAGGAPVPPVVPQDPGSQFVVRLLGETGEVWDRKIAELGGRYPPPQLVLFSEQLDAACGLTTAASGPFYCPGNQNVYIDLAFLGELESRFGAPGDFARAYVIAHEVGHHLQALLGATEAVQKVRERSTPEVARRTYLAMELQADCYAGIWAKEANVSQQARGLKPYIQAGDVGRFLKAASDVGDDAIRRKSKGRVMPETFTHGSARQRSGWFMHGFESGRIQDCDSFNSPDL